jgi:hypothetical protein
LDSDSSADDLTVTFGLMELINRPNALESITENGKLQSAMKAIKRPSYINFSSSSLTPQKNNLQCFSSD